MKLFLSAPLLCLLTVPAAAQVTWYVDDDGSGDPFPGVSIPGNPAFSDPMEDGTEEHPFDDIEKAVVAASSGDTVLVLPSNFIGFYSLTSSIDLLGKSITVRSRDGASVTVLDGTGIPGVEGVLLNGNSTLQGLTFQNFDHGSSGGDNGGAIAVSAATPTIRECVFTDNHAYVGGAIYATNSNALVEDCMFLSNPAVHQGGAIYVDNGQSVVRSCYFEGNTANYGGAILIRSISAPSSLTTVEDSVFFQNFALAGNGYAGGLAKFDQGDVLRRTRFIANEAPGEGGAVLISGEGTVRSCTFNSNVCGLDNGGGIRLRDAAVATIASSTFTGNVGGAVVEEAAPAIVYGTMVNCISWANTPLELSSQISVSYSTILGGYGGAGNIDTDPLFENALGPDGFAGTLDDDLSLFGASPCIDAGNATASSFEYPTDLLGEPRVADHPGIPNTGIALVGQAIDMGAYEMQVSCSPQRTGIRRRP